MATRVEFRKSEIVGTNPSRFSDPIRITITLEVFEQVPANAIDVRFVWSPIWDFNVDQELDELEIGPFTALGRQVFTIESDPPELSRIPDPTGPTALLVQLSYNGKEFLHIGYHVVVSCDGELPEVFESTDQLTRAIGVCFPRQTSIEWDRAKSRTPSLTSSEEDEESSRENTPTSKRQKLEHRNSISQTPA